MKRQIRENWTIELTGDWDAREMTDGYLVLESGERMIWVVVYLVPGKLPKEALDDYVTEGELGPSQYDLDLDDFGIVGHARSKRDDDGVEHLFTHAASNGELVGLEFVYRDSADRSWALKCWRSVRYDRCGSPANLE
jgi:hypothetical protein